MKSMRLSLAKDTQATLGLVKSLIMDAYVDASKCLQSARDGQQSTKQTNRIDNELQVWTSAGKRVGEALGELQRILEGRY